MKSRLDTVMRIFTISGKDMASLLNVDGSLVSKWRSGKRSLNFKSPYIGKIINYIMQLDFSSNYARLRELLAADYGNTQSKSCMELELFFKEWLASDDSSKEGGKAALPPAIEPGQNCPEVFVEYGKFGARRALDILLRAARQKKRGAELLLASNASPDWLCEDENYLRRYEAMLSRLAKSGTSIKILLSANDTLIRGDIFMLRCVQHVLQEDTDVFYIPNHENYKLYYFLHILKNQCAVFSFFPAPVMDDSLVFFTYNKEVVAHYQAIAESFLDSAEKIFTRRYYNSNTEYINDLLSLMDGKEPLYCWYYPAPIFLRSQGLFKDILEQNGLTREDQQDALASYTALDKLGKKHSSRYFINIQDIWDALSLDTIEIPNWSHICGKTITVDRDLFFQLFRESLDRFAADELLEIGLCARARPVSLETHVHKGRGICVRSVHEGRPVALFTNNSHYTESIWQSFDVLWKETHWINRDKTSVLRKLTDFLKEAESAYL